MANLQLGATYLAQEKWREAIVFCQSFLEQNPNSAPAYLMLAQGLLGEAAWEGARRAYLKALEHDPNFFPAHLGLANLYGTYGWLDEAIAQYQKAAQLRDDPDVYYNLGVAFHWQGNFAEAEKCYQKTISLQRNYASAYYNLAGLQADRGDSLVAIETYKKLIKIQPNYIDAYNNLGCILEKLERIDEALAVYQKALKIQPNSAPIYHNIGHVLAKDYPDRALNAYRRALEIDPQLTSAYYNIGKIFQLQNLHEEAIVYFQKALEQQPDNLAIYTDCGFSWMLKGNFPAAMVYLQKAIECQPEFVKGYCQWADLLAETDQLDQAKKACAQFLQALLLVGRSPLELTGADLPSVASLSPTDQSQDVYYYLAKTYLHLGNVVGEYGVYTAAANYYQKALQLRPNLPELYLALGQYYAQQKRENTAIALYHLCLTLTDHNHSDLILQVWSALGQILEKQGKSEKAIVYYEKILNSGLLTESNYHLTLSSYQLGKNPYPLPQGVYKSTWEWLSTHQLNDHYIKLVMSVGEVLVSAKDSATPQPLSTANQHSQSPSSESCGGLTCSPCLKRINDWFQPSNLGWGIFHLSSQVNLPITYPETFVAQIPYGRVWVVPNRSHWLICKAIAILSSDNYLLADLSRYYPGQLPGCQADDPTQHNIFTDQEYLPEVEYVDGTIAVLTGLSNNVYFHWLVDILPRWELLRLAEINLDQIDYFLVNSYQANFQWETLESLGVPMGKIIEADRHPHLQAKNLITPSFPSYLGWPSPWVIEFLRRNFGISANPLHDLPKRIYISRNQAKHRRVFNESEVEALLAKYGFTSISLEGMSVVDQIALFAHAQVIIAPHGSALANTIFCQPGTKVLELVSPHYIGHYYWVSSYYLGLDHYFLTGEVFECYPIRQLMYQTPLTEDILVNLTRLQRMLDLAGI